MSTLKAEAIATGLEIVTGDRPQLITYADYVEIKLTKKNIEYLTALALAEIKKDRSNADIRITGINQILLPLAKQFFTFPNMLIFSVAGIILFLYKNKGIR